MKTILPAVRAAYRQRYRAMIGNLFFGPIEAVPLAHTATRLNFRRVDTGARISFLRSDLGESIFVQYFTA